MSSAARAGRKRRKGTMSEQERAYLKTLGTPLSKNERAVALEMHDQRRQLYQLNIARLQAELDHQRANLANADHWIKTLNEQWPDLGPNTMMLDTEQTRSDIRNGIPAYEIAVGHTAGHRITARYVPAETEQA